jgi:hypothetical protein
MYGVGVEKEGVLSESCRPGSRCQWRVVREMTGRIMSAMVLLYNSWGQKCGIFFSNDGAGVSRILFRRSSSITEEVVAYGRMHNDVAMVLSHQNPAIVWALHWAKRGTLR